MKLRMLFAVVLANLLVVAPVIAQDSGRDRSDRRARSSYQPNLISAEMILGESVRDRSGDEIGEIEGLVLDPSHREIAYVVVETEDDFLFFGDEVEKAVPWSALSFTRDDDEATVVLTVDKQRLDDAVEFTGDEVVGDAMFIRDVYQSFGDEYRQEYRKYFADQERSGDWRKPALRQADKIVGTDVRNRDRNEIGEIEDLVIEASGGKLVYAVIDLESEVRDRLGMVRDKIVTPWPALDTTGEEFVITTDERDLQKLVYNFDAKGVSGLEDPEFARHVHEIANIEPYWREQRMQQRFAEAVDRDRDRDLAARYRGDDRDLRADRGSRIDRSDWRDRRDRDERTTRRSGRDEPPIRTVEGTVERVMTRAIGRMDEMVLKVRTNDGDVVYARMGPEWYAEQEDFDVREGDRVTIDGMALQRQGRPEVYIVRSVEMDDDTLHVRDERFQPEWQTRRYGGGR